MKIAVFLCLFFFLGCFSSDFKIKENRKKLVVSDVVNKTENINLDQKINGVLKRKILESGYFNYSNGKALKNLAKIDYSLINGDVLITSEITSFNTNISNTYQIPFFLYLPHYSCEIQLTVYIYTISTKKLLAIERFKATDSKYLGIRFFTVDKNDPDLMLASSEKNSVIYHTIDELSEEVVDYLKLVVK